MWDKMRKNMMVRNVGFLIYSTNIPQILSRLSFCGRTVQCLGIYGSEHNFLIPALMKLVHRKKNKAGVDRKVPPVQKGKAATCCVQLSSLWVKKRF